MIKFNFDMRIVVDILLDNSILVACSDALIKVTDCKKENKVYQILSGSGFNSVSINETASVILERFKSEFLDKKFNENLIDF